MFNRVWQKISGIVPAAPQDSLKSVAGGHSRHRHDMDNAPEVFSDQYMPLWKLQAKRQILEVKIDNSDVTYQTIIIAIDIQRGILWLDDLFPSQHHLEIGDHITLRHHRNGDQLSFSSPLLAWGRDYGASGLAIILPEELSYQPRRQTVRCDLAHKAPIVVKVRPSGYDASFGTLKDLSLGGLRLSVAGNLLGQLRHGDLLPVCELTLSDELRICCSARVRAFRVERNSHRCTQISVEFIDLPIEKQKQLQKFIDDLQHNQVSQQRQLEQLEPVRQSA